MIIGKSFEDRERMLAKIKYYVDEYGKGNCADGIALAEIKRIIMKEEND